MTYFNMTFTGLLNFTKISNILKKKKKKDEEGSKVKRK